MLFALTIGSVSVADAGPKKYYVTQPDTFDGNEALTACDDGYHMATFWEIYAFFNLKYDTTRGRTTADSGSGPCNSDCTGWVRTGDDASTANQAGTANCDAWMSDNSGHYGTQVFLSRNWSDFGKESSPWRANTDTCDNKARVWCAKN